MEVSRLRQADRKRSFIITRRSRHRDAIVKQLDWREEATRRNSTVRSRTIRPAQLMGRIMTMTLDRPPATGLAIPSARTIINLAIGGFAGLGLWEIFSHVFVQWVSGQDLSPPSLVQALVSRWLGLDLSFPTASFVHYLTGFLFYPIGYYILTRYIRSFGLVADGVIWGVLTFILALGILAPLAGFPFLLHTQGPWLAIMSLVGHIAYALLAAYVFERFERS
jgi:hypothetical protein